MKKENITKYKLPLLLLILIVVFSIIVIAASNPYTCLVNTQGVQVFKPDYSIMYKNDNTCSSSTSLKQYSCTTTSTTSWFSALFMTSSSTVTCQNGCQNNACVSCIDNDHDGYGQGCLLGADCNDANAAINPVAQEVCDNLDNDCDVAVDENVKNTCTDYATCSSYQTCDACPSTPVEVCDNLDNNCNAQIDEGVRNACGTCGVVPSEVCDDNLDNDCDGQVDEGCTVVIPPGMYGPGNYNVTLKFKHNFRVITRYYEMHIPPTYRPGTPTPVILAFHGGGGDTPSIVKSSQLNAKSDKSGFVVVYPRGSGLNGTYTWNAGECCGFAKNTSIDDVEYVDALIAQLPQNVSIDPTRIYLTGHSNGALMTYRLACERSEKFAAIAPNAGHDAYKSCNPTRAIPVLYFAGTNDTKVLYNGGSCGESSPWNCTSAPNYVSWWATKNKCSGVQTSYQNRSTTCITYQTCANNSDVTLCTVGNGGHTWPGGQCEIDAKWWRDAVGPLSSDISATDTMWNFFQAHPLR